MSDDDENGEFAAFEKERRSRFCCEVPSKSYADALQSHKSDTVLSIPQEEIGNAKPTIMKIKHTRRQEIKKNGKMIQDNETITVAEILKRGVPNVSRPRIQQTMAELAQDFMMSEECEKIAHEFYNGKTSRLSYTKTFTTSIDDEELQIS